MLCSGDGLVWLHGGFRIGTEVEDAFQMVVLLQFLNVLLGDVVEVGGPQKQTLPDRFVANPNPSQIPGVDYALEQTHILILAKIRKMASYPSIS